MDDTHELIVKVKDLAIELGRTPFKVEFEKSFKGGKYRLAKAFGNYETLLLAAGLKLNTQRRITNQIFEKDIELHLGKFVPRQFEAQEPYPQIASISDIHWPFVNEKVVNRFLEYVGDVKPTYVFINGDAWDMYSHTKFPRSHNAFTPRDEQNSARAANEAFWKEVQLRTPQSQCIQMMGNHDIRPLKRIMECYPEAEDWIVEKMKQLFTFPNVKTIMDPREEFIIGNIAIFHGYRGKLGDHRDFTMYNTINGHTHRGGVVFRQIRGSVLWELNSGLAGNAEAKGLTYTPQKISEWTPGFGAVDTLGPRFIHV